MKDLRSILGNQLARFMMVGIINTALSYLIYIVLLYLGAHYSIANLLALIGGIVISFQTQGKYVFDNPDPKLFPRFAASWMTIYILSVTIIGTLVHSGLNAYLAGLVALPVTTASSYLIQRNIVFRKPDQNSKPDP